MAHFVQSCLWKGQKPPPILSRAASLRSRSREEVGRKGKMERDWGERVGDAYFKNPLLLIAVDVSVHKFLTGLAVMSNLLRVPWCVLMRDKHDAGIKEMCSSGIRFGRSKLPQLCSNFTSKPEL